MLAFRSQDFDALLPTTVSGSTLSATAPSFGLPGLPGKPVRAFNPANLILALPVPLSVQVTLARQLLVLLTSTNRYATALELVLLFKAIAQKKGDPDFEALAQPLIDEAWTVACMGLTNAVQNLDSSNPHCVAEHARFARPVMSWSAVMLSLENTGTAPDAPCAPWDAIGGMEPPYLTKVGQKAMQTAENIAGDALGWLRCECRETPMAEWSVSLQLNCPTVGFTAAFSVDPSGLFTDDAEWAVAVDSVERAGHEVTASVLVGQTADAAHHQVTLVDPHREFVRELAYAACRRDGDAEQLGRLLGVTGARQEILDDAQYCASSLRAEGRTSADAPVGEPVVLGGGDAAGQRTTIDSVRAPRDGFVRLRGPIATHRCPDTGARESEELAVIAVGAMSQAEVRRVSSLNDVLLANPIDLAVDDLRDAVGLMPDQGTDVRLEVVRESPGCAGLYGAAPVVLFQVTVRDADRVLHLKFDETSGTVAKDSSGAGNDGTLIGATFEPGLCMGAVRTTSDGQRVEVPHAPALNLTGSYTIAAWIHYTAVGGFRVHSIVAKMDEMTIDSGWELLIYEWTTPGAGLLQFLVYGSGGQCNVGLGDVPGGGWHHVAVTGSAGAPFTLYLDGVPLGSSSIGCTMSPTTSPLTIGGRTNLIALGGAIDDLRIYERELSVAELAALADPSCTAP